MQLYVRVRNNQLVIENFWAIASDEGLADFSADTNEHTTSENLDCCSREEA